MHTRTQLYQMQSKIIINRKKTKIVKHKSSYSFFNSPFGDTANFDFPKSAQLPSGSNVVLIWTTLNGLWQPVWPILEHQMRKLVGYLGRLVRCLREHWKTGDKETSVTSEQSRNNLGLFVIHDSFTHSLEIVVCKTRIKHHATFQ